MLFIGLLITTAIAEPKKVSYIDFEVIEVQGNIAKPSLKLVKEKPAAEFKPLSELYIVEPARLKRVACSAAEIPELGMNLDEK